MTAKFAALTLVAVLGWTGSVHAAGTVEAGQAKSATCMACHGMDGNSANPEWPSLAGQHSSYIVKQLKHFKAGERQNALMSPMAMILSDQDMEDLAAYFSSQTPRPTGETEPSKLKRGQRDLPCRHRLEGRAVRAPAATARAAAASRAPRSRRSAASTRCTPRPSCAATRRAPAPPTRTDDAHDRGQAHGRRNRRRRLVPPGHALNLAARRRSEATMNKQTCVSRVRQAFAAGVLLLAAGTAVCRFRAPAGRALQAAARPRSRPTSRRARSRWSRCSGTRAAIATCSSPSSRPGTATASPPTPNSCACLPPGTTRSRRTRASSTRWNCSASRT